MPWTESLTRRSLLTAGAGFLAGLTGGYTLGRWGPGLPDWPGRPSPSSGPAAPTALPLGVEIVDTDPITGLDLARQIGVTWVRLLLGWQDLEPQPGVFQWEAADRLLTAALERGLRPLVVLTGVPPWAGPEPGGPLDEAGQEAFARLLAAAARRYGPRGVKHWELFNEPDNGDFARRWLGGSWGRAPEAYAALLRRAYPALKAADPTAHLVMGGLALDWFTDDDLHPHRPGPFVRDFLDRVLAAGGGVFFDIANFHYYPNFRPRWEPHGRDIMGKAAFLRRTLAAYGVSKPVLCTEIGAWVDPDRGGSRDGQATYAVQAMVRGMAADLQAVIWFNLVDLTMPGMARYGLVTREGIPRPAFRALQVLRQRLDQAVFVRPLTPGDLGTEGVEGYLFYAPLSGTQIQVIWATAPVADLPPFRPHRPNVQRTVRLPQPPARLLDRDGQPRPPAASLTVGPQPLSLEYEGY